MAQPAEAAVSACKRHRSALAAHGLLLLVASTLGACGCESSDPPRELPADVLLRIDAPSGAIRIRDSEVGQWFDYLHSVDRSLGRNTRIAAILGGYLIPLALAERDHADARTAQLALARGLFSAVGGRNGGAPELRAKGARLLNRDWPTSFARGRLPLALDAWLFDPDHLGQISDPIPSGQGYWLGVATEIHHGSTRIGDRVDAVVIPFFAIEGDEYVAWLARSRQELADSPIHVHPDYEEALPGEIYDARRRQRKAR